MIGNIKVPTIFTAVDKVSQTVDKMQGKVSGFQKTLNKVGTYAAIGGTALFGMLGYAANEAIKFEDKMADVAKTTGLSGKALQAYGDDLLNISKKTRTTIDDLQTIGAIGGQMAVPAEQLAKFTEEANKFGVALGSDFSGGVEEAVNQVAKINKLFNDTKGLDISESITRTGSAMNFLSSKGTATAANMNDFVLRMGAMPDALKPSFQSTVALGAMLEELGIDSERGASGVKNLLTTAAKELPSYAKQMKLSVGQARELLATNPAQFLADFSKTLNGLKPDVLAKKLKMFKVNSLETIAVVGQLSGNTDLYAQKLAFANQSFREATSLQEEYNTKNDSTAGKIKQAINNFQAFAIVVGTQLLPVLNELITKGLPIVQNAIEWIQANKELIPLIAGLAAGLIALKVVLVAYNAITTIATAVSTAFSIAINSALWPILALVAAIAIVIAIFYYWDDICAWFAKQWEKFTSWIGNLWDSVVKWFQEFDFINFFKKIGNSIIDWMLNPIKMVLSLVSKIPGKIGDMAKSALEFTQTIKFDVEENPSAQLSPNTTSQMVTNENITTNKSSIQVDFNDKNNNIGKIQQFGQATPVFVNGTKFGQ